MKKLLIIPITFLAAGSFFLNACGNTSFEKGMKAPAQTNEDIILKRDKISIAEPASSIIFNDAPETLIENRQAAFKSETISSARYAAYSKKAEQEGYHQIALLFKAVSTSENIHANKYKTALQQSGVTIPIITTAFSINSTKENLKEAIAEEKYEINKRYPGIINEALQRNNEMEMRSLNYTNKTEKKHKLFYKAELVALENNAEKYLPTEFYVCDSCGDTYHTKAPDNCINTQTAANNFIKINSL